MVKHFFLKLIFTMIGLNYLFFSFSQNKQEILDKNKTYLIEGNSSFPPYQYINEQGKPAGYTVDLIKEVMKTLNLKYTIVLKDWDEALDDLDKKKCNLVLNAIVLNSRKKHFDFSHIYYYTEPVAVSLKSKKIKSIQDLKDKRFVISKTNLAKRFLNKQALHADSILYVANPEKIKGVLDGKYDITIDYVPTINYYLKKYNFPYDKITITKLYFEKNGHAFVFHKGQAALVNAVNSALWQLEENGTSKKITEKWLPTTLSSLERKGLKHNLLYRIIEILSLILILIFLVWIIYLKKKKYRSHQLFIYNLLQNIPYPILLIDNSNSQEILFTNKMADSYNNATIKGTSQLWYNHLLQLAQQEYNLHTKQWQKTIVLNNKNSEMLYTINSFYNLQQEFLLILGLPIDEFISLTKKAEEAQKLKSAFLANMSHDLRTPLNAIEGFSELLLENEDKEEVEKFAKIIELNTNLLLDLLTDIVDISQIQTGNMTFNRHWTILNPLFYDLSTMANERIRTFGKDIKVIIDEPYEKLEAKVDYSRLMRVSANIVNNAIKYTTSGYIRIGALVIDKYLYIYVADTGIGISKEKQEEIFKRFNQINAQHGGNGLGLDICKLILQNSGSTIGVNSQEKVGSIFWIKGNFLFKTEPKSNYSREKEIEEIKQMMTTKNNYHFVHNKE